MKSVLARQVVGPGDLRHAGCFFPALLPHDRRTLLPQLHPGIGVYAVARDVTASHSAAGSIDDGVTAQSGDISLPKIDAL